MAILNLKTRCECMTSSGPTRLTASTVSGATARLGSLTSLLCVWACRTTEARRHRGEFNGKDFCLCASASRWFKFRAGPDPSLRSGLQDEGNKKAARGFPAALGERWILRWTQDDKAVPSAPVDQDGEGPGDFRALRLGAGGCRGLIRELRRGEVDFPGLLVERERVGVRPGSQGPDIGIVILVVLVADRVCRGSR